MLRSTPTVETGWQAQPFTLSDPDGRAHSLTDLYGKNGLLIAFICNHCPYVKASVDRFVADARVLQSEGINVVAINSNVWWNQARSSKRRGLGSTRRWN